MSLRWLQDGVGWRLRRYRTYARILFHWPDIAASWAFLTDRASATPVGVRWKLLRRLYEISFRVTSSHRQWEILTFVKEILRHPKGSCFVEAGCFKGSGTAKFSLAAAAAGARLYVFDSFEGIPDNAEDHGTTLSGLVVADSFREGAYAGSLEEVQGAVRRFGAIECCEFVKGWFEDTMPHFAQAISGAYVDVDLSSSTRTCIKYLFPLLRSGDRLVSQDGHLPLVIDVFRSAEFWRSEVGVSRMPKMEGLGTSKIVVVTKD